MSVLGLTGYKKTNGANYHVAVVDGDSDSDAFVYDSTNGWAAQKLGLAAGAKAEFVVFLDTLFMVNGSDATRSFDGTNWSTSTNVTDAPVGSHIALYNERLYISSGSEVRFSSLPVSSAITWTATDRFFVGQDDGQSIQWLGVVGNRLVILKERSIYVYDRSRLIEVANYGTPSSRSAVVYRGTLYFFNRDGIWAFNGNELTLISDKIDSFIQNLTQSTLGTYDNSDVSYDDPDYLYNDSALDNICAGVDKFNYYLFVGNVGSEGLSNVIIQVNLVRRWHTARAIEHQVNVFAPFEEASGQKLFIGTGDSRVLRFEDDTDYLGTSIASEAELKDFDLERPERLKRFNWVDIYSATAGYSLFYSVDEGSYRPLGYVRTRQQKMYFPASAYGSRLSLKIAENSTSDPWEFLGCVVDFTDTGDPKGEDL